MEFCFFHLKKRNDLEIMGIVCMKDLRISGGNQLRMTENL